MSEGCRLQRPGRLSPAPRDPRHNCQELPAQTRGEAESRWHEALLPLAENGQVRCQGGRSFPACPQLTCLFPAGETARRQQVPTSAPASENSSAAHSIGSTQSTPCSSSSTA